MAAVPEAPAAPTRPAVAWVAPADLALVAAVAVGSLLLARISVAFAVVPLGPPLVWLPVALGAAAVARMPPDRWAWALGGLALGVLICVRLVTGDQVLVGVAAALGSVLTALVAGLVLRATAAAPMRRRRDLLGLLLAAGAAGALGAIPLALVRPVTPVAAGAQGPLAWWAADAAALVTGVVLLTPLLLVLGRHVRIAWSRAAELLLLVLICAAVVTLLARWQPEVGTALPLQSLLIALLAWLAIRFGIVVAAAVAPTVLLIAVQATAARGALAPAADTWAQGWATVASVQLFLVVTALVIDGIALLEEERRRAARHEERAHALVDQLLENTPAKVFVKWYRDGDEGRFVVANREFTQALGRTPEEVLGLRELDLLPAEAATAQEAKDRRVLRTGQVSVVESGQDVDGVERFHHTARFPIRDEGGRVVAVGGISFDVTDAHRREEQLRLMFDESPVASARISWGGTDAGEILDANESMGALLGVDHTTLPGRRLEDFLHPDERRTPIVVDGETGRPRPERQFVRADGEHAWVLVSSTVLQSVHDREAFALVMAEDITARKQAEETLTHQALHDALTGLLNRYALIDRLDAALSRLWRSPRQVAVLFCDLDGFKHLNDTLGHRLGDELLVLVASRLRMAVRPEDTVARLGGDEFVVVCEGLENEDDARLIAERIRVALHEPFDLTGRDFSIGGSIGVALTSDPQLAAEDLLRRADLAMYHAKDGGRDRVEFYAREFEEQAVAHLQVQEDIRTALAEDRVVVHYQPILDLDSGEVLGVEALARIQDPVQGLLAPDSFIEVAESSGLVGPLGESVLLQSLVQVARWREQGRTVSVAVNVSPRQLASASFAPLVLELLARNSIEPWMLTIEVTERAVVAATGPSILTLRRLRSQGVHVAIDDFGTGYSSLTSLKHLPADIVKVDRAFVAGLTTSPDDAAIVSAVITVAHDLGRVVVAEGVETEAQAAALAWLGCDQVQGFWYARPKPADEVALVDGPPMRRPRRGVTGAAGRDSSEGLVGADPAAVRLPVD